MWAGLAEPPNHNLWITLEALLPLRPHWAYGHRMAWKIEHLGFAPNFVDYTEALEIQRRTHADVVDGKKSSTFLVLEHSPVYTAGKRTQDHERPRDGTEVIDIDRGGKITWHGPGQLVVYPIYRLNDQKEVRLFVDQIERAGIELLAEYGINARQVEGRSGVWITDGSGPDRKILAIGIRIHNGVAMHGLALNCSNELAGFENIVPCGIPDAAATSISIETGSQTTPEQAAPRLLELLDKHITA